MSLADSQHSIAVLEFPPTEYLCGVPPELQDAIVILHRARREAMDEIERLLSFLDETEFDIPQREIDRIFADRFGERFDDLTDADFEPDSDLEPDVDDEPSLAGFDGLPVHSGMDDLEGDPAEAGIADLDGLIEQIGRAE